MLLFSEQRTQVSLKINRQFDALRIVSHTHLQSNSLKKFTHLNCLRSILLCREDTLQIALLQYGTEQDLY